MAYHIYELGKHIYFTTSEDSLTWNAPEILYNNDADYGKVPEYTDGPLAGKTDDKFVAVNPDIGALFELAIAKSDVGLENASSFKILPSLINADDGDATTDTLCVADDIACWPVVVLD